MTLSSSNISGYPSQLSNAHSFLYLHPNENPTTPLVSPILDSFNYHSWRKSMIMALSVKNKLEFINEGTRELVREDISYMTWKRCSDMVALWIIHLVSPNIRQSIMWIDDAEEIWKDLKSRYAQGDHLRVSDLQLEASLVKQGDLTVTKYFSKLRIVWDKLENLKSDPTCTWLMKYTCEVSSTVAERKTRGSYDVISSRSQ